MPKESKCSVLGAALPCINMIRDGTCSHHCCHLPQVEKLLAEVNALDTQQGDDSLTPQALDNRTRLYERVASEVSRLKYFLAKGHQFPSLQQLQPRAESAVERLSFLLSQALDAALRGGHQSAVLHCLQAYAAVGDTTGAEKVCCNPGNRCFDSHRQVPQASATTSASAIVR